MNINKINNIKFEAGNVYTNKINDNSLKSYNAIKKIAEEKNIDVYISRNHESRHLPAKDLYLVLATKEKPIYNKSSLQTGVDFIRGASFSVVDKNAGNKELSVKIFNATMNAVENLEKKLCLKK